MVPKQQSGLPDSAADLISAGEASRILGIHYRSTLTRRVEAGTVPFVAQLDDGKGPYVFDRKAIEALAAQQRGGKA